MGVVHEIRKFKLVVALYTLSVLNILILISFVFIICLRKNNCDMNNLHKLFHKDRIIKRNIIVTYNNGIR